MPRDYEVLVETKPPWWWPLHGLILSAAIRASRLGIVRPEHMYVWYAGLCRRSFRFRVGGSGPWHSVEETFGQ